MEFTVIDLTKPLNHETMIFKEGDYSDPEFEVAGWTNIDALGFRVSLIRMGTQTGTHLDAPAHFLPEGDCLEALDPSCFMGTYFLVDLGKYSDIETVQGLCSGYANEKILFIRAFESSTSTLRKDSLDVLLSLPPLLWVVDGQIEVLDREKYGFHRILAESGKYLAEDLHSDSAMLVRPGGEMFAFPLRLEGTSGSPCRLIVRMPADS